MVVSIAVAVAGIGIAVVLLPQEPARGATRWRERFAGVRRLLLNKYYVDEIYDADDRPADPHRLGGGAVEGRRRPRHRRRGERRRRDRRAAASEVLRRLQTGSVRAYAASLFLGVVADPGVLPVAMITRDGSGRRARCRFPILTSLVALPIAGAILLLFVRGDEEQSAPFVRKIALIVSLLVFAETLLLWSRFNPASADFQFVERHAWIPAFGIDYAVGVDGISLLLLVLTGFLTPLALLSSWESVHKKTRAFCIFVLLLESAMMGVFVSLDLFLFYVFWDAMLMPMYFLIGIWGYERRIYAAIKFILYTMAGSVLMLLAILGLAYLHSTTHRQSTASTC